jgi:trimeric autotransporter adhesin
VSFPKPLTSLRYWASSHNPIANALDFSGFVSLESIECYRNAQLQEIVVSNLPALERLIVEGCNLQQLDLSSLPNLVDLRCAQNAFTNITLGDGTGPNVRNWITRNNQQLTQSFQDGMTNFYSLQNFWAWNNNQRGALSFVSTNLTTLRAYRNEYTDLDLANHASLELVWMHGKPTHEHYPRWQFLAAPFQRAR